MGWKMEDIDTKTKRSFPKLPKLPLKLIATRCRIRDLHDNF